MIMQLPQVLIGIVVIETMLLTAFLIEKYNTKLPRSPPNPDELIGFYNAEKSPIEKFTVEKVYLRTDSSFT